MNSLNSILLEGNLVRAVEAKSLPKGSLVCSFTVASNRSYRSGETIQTEASYFDVETWSGLAERCASELTKGRGVRVVGRLKQERWADPDGQKRSKVKIIAEHVEFKPLSMSGAGQQEDAAAEEELETEGAPY